jgi:epoxide hydrolase A/B
MKKPICFKGDAILDSKMYSTGWGTHLTKTDTHTTYFLAQLPASRAHTTPTPPKKKKRRQRNMSSSSDDEERFPGIKTAAEGGDAEAQLLHLLHVNANGLKVAVYDTGNPVSSSSSGSSSTKGDAITLLFLHGFPELAVSWGRVIRECFRAGYRCIAPDLRGYGLTTTLEPESSESIETRAFDCERDQFSLRNLVGDCFALLDALGIRSVVLVGHDWGGAVVWSVPRVTSPATVMDRILGLVGVNTPSPRPADLPPKKAGEELVDTSNPRYYARTFVQTPGVANSLLSADVRKTFRMFMTRGGLWDVNTFRERPESSPERRMDVLTMLEQKQSELEGEPFLSQVMMDYFVATYESTGFAGGLNWYRYAAAADDQLSSSWRVDSSVPCLYVGAEHDVILPPSRADGMEDFIERLEKRTIMDCGHWTQQEKPKEFSHILLDWLARNVKGTEPA